MRQHAGRVPDLLLPAPAFTIAYISNPCVLLAGDTLNVIALFSSTIQALFACRKPGPDSSRMKPEYHPDPRLILFIADCREWHHRQAFPAWCAGITVSNAGLLAIPGSIASEAVRTAGQLSWPTCAAPPRCTAIAQHFLYACHMPTPCNRIKYSALWSSGYSAHDVQLVQGCIFVVGK